MYRAGQLPCRATQLPTGTIIVYPEERRSERVALYARVASHDQQADMERQLNRLRDYAAANNLRVSRELSEIGSGLNGHRKKLLAILADSVDNIHSR